MGSAIHRMLYVAAAVQAYAASIALLAIGLLITLDVGRRFLFNRSFPGAIELSSLLLPIVIFLGWPMAYHLRKHVAVEILVDKLRSPIQAFLRRLSALIVAIVCGFFLWSGVIELQNAVRYGTYGEGIVRVPDWPAWIAIVGGVATMVAQAIATTVLAKGRIEGKTIEHNEPSQKIL